MKIPFIALILQGIPEQIAVATLAFVIANLPLDWRKIVGCGILLGISSYTLRLLPITFGIPTILLMSILFILLVKIGKSNINSALVSSLFSFLGLIVVESVCLLTLMPIFEVTPEELFTNTAIRIFIGLPQVIIMFLIAFTVYKVKNWKKKKNSISAG